MVLHIEIRFAMLYIFLLYIYIVKSVTITADVAANVPERRALARPGMLHAADYQNAPRAVVPSPPARGGDRVEEIVVEGEDAGVNNPASAVPSNRNPTPPPGQVIARAGPIIHDAGEDRSSPECVLPLQLFPCLCCCRGEKSDDDEV